MTHDDYINTLKGYLLKKMVKSSLKYILVKAPFLAWGPLGYITELILEKLVSIMINQTELALFLKFTDFRVSRQGKVFHNAILRNQTAQKGGNPDEIKIAEQELKDTFRDLIKFTN